MHDAIKKYLNYAVSIATSDTVKINDILDNHLPYSMHDGVFFPHDGELYKLYNQCQSMVFAKRSGYSRLQITSKEIEHILYRSALTQFLTKEDQTKECIAKIKELAESTIEYVVPNNILVLEDNVQSYTIGPVMCLRAEGIQGRLAQGTGKIKFLPSEERHGLVIENGETIFKISPQVFLIRLNCSPENAKAEATWNIDIASSLYRLYTIQIRHTYGVYPFWGATEPAFNQPSVTNDAAISSKGENFSFHSGRRLPQYSMHEQTLTKLSETDFEAVCEKVFFPDEKSIQPALQLALGWMSKARRTEDLPAKFLFFFTALEAVLSRKDNGSPIIDTIARNASVLIAQPTSRYELYAIVKRLYATRSMLVHSGYREVIPKDCELLQKITESICVSIIKKFIDLKSDVFHSLLKEHSVNGTPFEKVEEADIS